MSRKIVENKLKLEIDKSISRTLVEFIVLCLTNYMIHCDKIMYSHKKHTCS